MAIGVPREEMLAAWDEATFTTAPPDELAEATEDEIRALMDTKPEELVESVDFGDGGQSLEQDRVSRFGYVNEANKLYVGKAFTLEQFADWWSVQSFGSLPFNGVGIHHTAIPDRNTWQGLQHLHNTFAYYNRQLGWPNGKGPQLWLRSKRAGRVPGPVVYVGTHPASDGIGISYRNHRWLHIEFIDRFTYYGMDKDDLELYRAVLKIVCGERKMPIKSCAPGHDGPRSPIGCLFHREARTDIKDCPGAKVLPGPFFAEMNKSGGSPSKPAPTKPTPSPAPAKTRYVVTADGKQTGVYETLGASSVGALAQAGKDLQKAKEVKITKGKG